MSKLEFHKCKICGALFWHLYKTVYCNKCVPYIKGQTDVERSKSIYSAINNECSFTAKEHKRKKERERWHKRMENPVFRERERVRSSARVRGK